MSKIGFAQPHHNQVSNFRTSKTPLLLYLKGSTDDAVGCPRSFLFVFCCAVACMRFILLPWRMGLPHSQAACELQQRQWKPW